MDYLLLKWLHVFSSMLLFGTGIGSAYYLLFVSLKADTRAVAMVTRYVVVADWCFTAPTVIFQPVSGILLARLAGFPFHKGWLAWSMDLYVLAILCWLPVVWMQIRMRDMAQEAAEHAMPLPRRYWRLLAWWSVLGTIAFLALMAILYLMVVK